MEPRDELYMNQSELWFEEHNMIEGQLRRTILHYEELASINRKELELHIRRTELATQEHNAWLKENGFEG